MQKPCKFTNTFLATTVLQNAKQDKVFWQKIVLQMISAMDTNEYFAVTNRFKSDIFLLSNY